MVTKTRTALGGIWHPQGHARSATLPPPPVQQQQQQQQLQQQQQQQQQQQWHGPGPKLLQKKPFTMSQTNFLVHQPKIQICMIRILDPHESHDDDDQ